MVVAIEGVEIEPSSLLDVGRVRIDEDIRGVGFHCGEEVEAVELSDVDAVAQGGNVFDPLDERRLVVAGINLPFADLFEPADGACVEDAGAVGAVEKKSGKAEGEVVSLTGLVDGSLVVPLLNGDEGVVDELTERVGAVGRGDGAPERGNANIDIVDVDVVNSAVGQES